MGKGEADIYMMFHEAGENITMDEFRQYCRKHPGKVSSTIKDVKRDVRHCAKAKFISAKTYRILLKKAKPHCYMARIKACYAPGSLWEDGTETLQQHVDLEFSNGHIESQLIVNVDNTDRRLSINTGDDVYVYIREYGDLQRRDIILVDELENRKEVLSNAL